jgi:AcrR family transcriptional regulator
VPRPRIPDRRERLLDAAEGLVLARGFDAVNVATIAAEAGVGKGAVYLEFSSKHAILDALLQRGNARMADRVRRELGDQPSLSAAYRASARALLDDPLMSAAFLDDRGVLGVHALETTDDRYRERHTAVIAWVRHLQAQGRIVEDVTADALALALSSATIGLLSAARLLGPLDAAQLESAIDAIGRMAASLEKE